MSGMKKRKKIRGRCYVCGCEEFSPCPNGCAWTDRTYTRCTACRCADCGLKFERPSQYKFDSVGYKICRARRDCRARVEALEALMDQKPSNARRQARKPQSGSPLLFCQC
jgi:hypothetical protein